MSKLVVTLILTILVAGILVYVVGTQIGPATVDSGNKTSVKISNAFN
jgi:archaellum component FlaG (FlaF/FlaG flagellin family)